MCEWCRDFEDAHCWMCGISLSAPNRWCNSTAHIDGGQAYRNFLESVAAGHVPTTYIEAEGNAVLLAELMAVEEWNRDVQRLALAVRPDGLDEADEPDLVRSV